MKKEKIQKRLERHYSEKRYVRLIRSKGYFEEITTGFIIGKSDNFIFFQETDDFKALGYIIFPIKTIKHARYNRFDKAIHRILKKEGQLKKIRVKYKIDLTSWESIAKYLKKTKLTIISQCEHPKKNSFCIGKIKEINQKSISIQYFDAEGILDKTNTKNKFKHITKLSFDNRYANIFSKYVKNALI